MRNLLYAFACLALFAAGAYTFKAKHSGLLLETETLPQLATATATGTAADHFQQAQTVIVEIAGEKIFQDDIDWEYELLTEGVFDKETMTPIPDLGPRYHEELASLRKALIASLVERKVLYSYILQDKDFDAKDPGLFVDCMKEWQEAVAAGSKAVKTRENRTRLKARLCERAVLERYVQERIKKQIKIEDAEILEYYKNHAAEYRRPERVTIRQILLGDEPAAKKVRNQVNAGNFDHLARQNSIAPEAAQGGKLGPFAKGGMPSVFDIAFHMKRGEISPILKSPYGYHILTVVDKLPATEASFEEVKGSIAHLLRQRREEDEHKKLVEKALAAVSVTTPTPLW